MFNRVREHEATCRICIEGIFYCPERNRIAKKDDRDNLRQLRYRKIIAENRRSSKGQFREALMR